MSYALCLHRWVGDQALYEQYDLPAGHSIRAICTPESVSSLPRKHLASHVTVASMDDPNAVNHEVDQIVAEHGNPALVVGLNEGDLLTAATLRERFGLPGDHGAWIERFRDKLQMNKVAAQQTAIRVLPVVVAQTAESVFKLADDGGYPVVVKPRYGTASRNVRFVNGPEDLCDAEDFLNTEPMLAQQYCSAPICHVDGWWDGQRVVIGTASVYLNNCAEFGPDRPLGSVELSPGRQEDRLIQSTEAFLQVFTPKRDIVFHLELFDTGDDLVFLEIGARVGGAEVPYIWREIRDVDLVGVAWELQTQASTTFRDRARKNSWNGRPIGAERGAWVIAQAEIESQAIAPTLYWSLADEPKRPASGVYEGAETRLRLRSAQHSDLQRDARKYVADLSGHATSQRRSQDHLVQHVGQ